MNDPLVLAVISVLGGGGFATVMAAFFARRKNNADADLTVGTAWEKFVQQQERTLEKMKIEANQLKGELRSAERRVAVLERQLNELQFWQGRMIARSETVDELLRENDLPVPASVAAPVLRERNTRATDFEAEDRAHSPSEQY